MNDNEIYTSSKNDNIQQSCKMVMCGSIGEPNNFVDMYEKENLEAFCKTFCCHLKSFGAIPSPPRPSSNTRILFFHMNCFR